MPLWSRWRRWLVLAMAVSVVATLWMAVTRPYGDFAVTLPGGYARELNPSLWDSPDLRGSWAFHKDTYLHGPVQYLTLYPLALLDSYRAIAWTLLPLYALVLAGAVVAMSAALRALNAPLEPVPLAATLVLFVPALQALAHREFEVVLLLAFTAGLWAALRDRHGLVGAVLAYAAWFKYIPLAFVGYLALRGWWRALAACVATSAAILVASEYLFGLSHFFDNNVPTHASHAFDLSDAAFCLGWSPTDETLSSIRQGLCRLQDQVGLAVARNLYVAVCAGVAAWFLASFVRLSKISPSARTDAGDARWRTALEYSVVLSVVAAFLFGHYYYLSALWIPFVVLLARLVCRGGRLVWWSMAYVLVSLATVPAALLSWALGLNSWTLYMGGPVYLYGDLLLVALLLWEYDQLSRADRRHAADGPRGVGAMAGA